MAALSTTAQKDNVKVVIRVRPINERERAGAPIDKVKQCLTVERNAHPRRVFELRRAAARCAQCVTPVEKALRMVVVHQRIGLATTWLT